MVGEPPPPDDYFAGRPPPPNPGAYPPPGAAPPPGGPGWALPPPPQNPYGPPGAYAPPGGYQQPFYGAPQVCGTATKSMWVAIIGLFVCGLILGVWAIKLSSEASAEIAASGGRLTGESRAQAGKVIGIIAIIGWAIIMMTRFA